MSSTVNPKTFAFEDEQTQLKEVETVYEDDNLLNSRLIHRDADEDEGRDESGDDLFQQPISKYEDDCIIDVPFWNIETIHDW